ncbi:DUF2110 family protein, partial [Candidatus Bathyarchaeota archaeon]|nr:DUF2110 family protein [Candidatus Bathyarchaeota archaeon]
MPIITVLEKLIGSISPEMLEKVFCSFIKGLLVQLSFAGLTKRGWIKLDVVGNDETIALNLINQKVGLVPSINLLKKYSVIKGKIVKSPKNLHIDFGVLSKDTIDAVISKKRLQGQLVDGKDISFGKLVELFCLHENIPLEIKLIQKIRDESKTLEAVLSEGQLSIFRRWISYRFDRLIVSGSLFFEVEQAVRLSNHSRDVIKIESLGVFDHVILCKLGTDAVGLIPKIGRYLKSGILVPFSPKKIFKFVDSKIFD